MTVALAAKKAAPLAPGEFRFITKAIQIDKSGEDNRRRFKMVMSSTLVDEGNDEVKLSALHDLEMGFKRGLNIFTDHEHKVDKVFGRSDTAEVMESGLKDPKTGAPIYDLHVGGVVNEPDPKMVQLADSIDGGYVTFGASIGARVTSHQRNKAGGLDIYHFSPKEGSLVGIPMQTRAWTYKSSLIGKAVNAAEQLGEESFLPDDDDDEPDTEKALDTEDGDALIRQDLKGPKRKAAKCPTCGGDMDADGDCPDEYHTAKTGADTVDTIKGDLSAAARDKMPDSEFACPEKRKYPINDAAHVRAALSRVADPSNDQCGKAKIIAAARRMGIGQHAEKALDEGEIEVQKELADREAEVELLAEAATWADQITTDADGFEVITEKSADETSPETADGQASDTAAAASPETPETASEDGSTPDGEADPATEKALTFEAVDVLTLAMKARDLAQAVNHRDAEIVALKAERDSLATEIEVAKQVIEKMLTLPLRSKTAGYVEDLSKRLPDFLAPEVKTYLTKIAGDDQ